MPVEDGNEDGSTPVAQTFNFTVTAVNDPPVLTGDLTATVAEGGSYVITGADLGFSDPDDGAAGVTFTVSNQVNGTLLVNGVARRAFTRPATGRWAGVSFRHDGSRDHRGLVPCAGRGRQRGRLDAGGADLQLHGDAASTIRRC